MPVLAHVQHGAPLAVVVGVLEPAVARGVVEAAEDKPGPFEGVAQVDI